VKVLYLDHPEADFLSSIVYMGLCQELGPENVVDYPFKRSFHGEVHRYPSPYAIDLSGEGLPWQRLAKEGPGSVGTTAPFDWMIPQPGREWGRGEVLARLEEFDLVVLAAPRIYNAAALRDIIAAVGRERLPPLVLVDGEDYSALRTDLVDEFKPSVYFKRELLPGHSTDKCRLEPFPFASPVPLSAPVKKDIDVLFLGGMTWASRAEACIELKREFGSRFVGGVVAHIPHREYIATIARAKVAVSVRGFGFDTLRFWEIPSCAGTMLVADRLPILKPHPFEDGRHACYFDDMGALVEIVRHALADETWRTIIAQAGNVHLRTFHTSRARAVSLLQTSLGG